jgi:hypothetical protein
MHISTIFYYLRDKQEDSGLQGCDNVLLGEWLPSFSRNIVPLSSGALLPTTQWHIPEEPNPLR